VSGVIESPAGATNNVVELILRGSRRPISQIAAVAPGLDGEQPSLTKMAVAWRRPSTRAADGVASLAELAATPPASEGLPRGIDDIYMPPSSGATAPRR
jgi:hypothetical protein